MLHAAGNIELRVLPALYASDPSAWGRRVRVSLVALAGFLIATYMGLYQWRLLGDVWDPVFGDQTKLVLDSDLSHMLRSWFRVPDSIFGAIVYLGDIVFAMAGSVRRWQYRPWLVIVFGLYVIPPAVVGILLVASQGLVVGAWCFPCIVTAIISLLLIILAYSEVFAALRYLRRVWSRGRSARRLWDTAMGRPSAIAHEVAEEMAKERGKAPGTHVATNR